MNTSPTTPAVHMPIMSIAITAKQDTSGAWTVDCPQQNYHGKTRNLTRLVALIVADIESHNEQQQPKRRKWLPVPDDGRMTPNRRIDL